MAGIHKSEIPAVLLLLPFILGIAIGCYFVNTNYTYSLSIGLALTSSGFILLNFLYRQFKIYQYSWLGSLLLTTTLLLSGWLATSLHSDLNNKQHFSKQRADFLIIKVTDEPKQNGRFFRCVTKVEQSIYHREAVVASGNLLLTLVADSNSHPLAYGDELLIPAKFNLVAPPYNPAEFNYKQYLVHQNIYHQCFLSAGQVAKLRTQAGNPIVAYALETRQQMVMQLKRYLHNPQAIAVASTLLLGYKADLDPDILKAYAKTGTIHVLSVSGAHVAVLFLLISFLLRPLNRFKHARLFRTTTAVSLIWGYALLTGFSPAVCRAALMISLLIIGKTFRRQAHGLNILAVSAFILLLYNPFLFMDVGFQLSYLAVVGLIIFQPIINQQFNFKNTWLRKLWYWCSASLAAQLITFPLSTLYFHQFPIYFLISNLFIILPSELIMTVGIAFLITSLIPALAPVTGTLGYLLEHFILWMNQGLSFIEAMPYSSLDKVWLTTTEFLLLCIVVGLITLFLSRKYAWQLTVALTSLLLLSISISFKAYHATQHNSLVFFNTKKHTAILLNFGHQGVVVTDLNQQDKNFMYSIQPCLDSLQIEKANLIQLHQNLQTTFLKKHEHYLQFQNKSLLIFDKHLSQIQLPQQLCVDYLLFTDNPHADLSFICKNYTFKQLIIDANNSAQRTLKLMHDADSLHIKKVSLKRNNALVIVSN
ncbi:ComEC family competence protein [Mucilaginibacter robiniae]|uniref:ComEC family competence protein n=1 Tax=Mucilaginibacter robiniae TaxID=2728022 RepID=A0A7L5EA87_9SPHI|nr:ComEC/Rec2 family competence protein [Mucilaginibacter robiniae]QJD97823.1 ComEC family competence protein [Mucilaginibacter robiniae]